MNTADSSGNEDNPYPGNYIFGEVRGQVERDCASKCTCGITTLAENAIGDPTSGKAGLTDLARGTK